jgi:hypothetical protein
MTITISTDPIVSVASTAKFLAVEITKTKIQTTRENRREKKYERMIRKSQKKIGPYKPVSYTTIYA